MRITNSSRWPSFTRPDLVQFARPATSGEDIRFTTKDDVLYAIALDWPGDRMTITSRGSASGLVEGEVNEVRLLGYDGKIEWSRSNASLTVKMPEHKPCASAFAVRISGLRWEKAPRLGTNAAGK